MIGDRRRVSTDWRPAMSARAIVAVGVWSLAMVLVATMTVGVGSAFLAGMGLLFVTLITIILLGHHRDGGGPEP